MSPILDKKGPKKSASTPAIGVSLVGGPSSSSSSSSSSATTSNAKTKKKKSYAQIEKSQLECAFDMFDTNHDGKLNSQEFRAMLANLGVELDARRIKSIILDASRNTSDDFIKQDDFLAWFSRFKTPKEDDVEADLRAAFLVFDRDKNGFITRDELKQAMAVMGESLSDRDIDELLTTTDLDRDGRINYEEFIKTLL